MLCGISVVFNPFADEFGLMRCKRSSENRQVLIGFQSTKAFGRLQHAGGGPAQCHRSISPSLHVATDATHGPHHVLDRVGQASERRSFAGRPRRLTVSISSSPSRMLAATPGASWSSRRARLRNSRSALSASSSSQAAAHSRRRLACHATEDRRSTAAADQARATGDHRRYGMRSSDVLGKRDRRSLQPQRLRRAVSSQRSGQKIVGSTRLRGTCATRLAP